MGSFASREYLCIPVYSTWGSKIQLVALLHRWPAWFIIFGWLPRIYIYMQVRLEGPAFQLGGLTSHCGRGCKGQLIGSDTDNLSILLIEIFHLETYIACQYVPGNRNCRSCVELWTWEFREWVEVYIVDCFLQDIE